MLTIGRNNFSPRETTIKRWQLADTMTWLRGQHKFKGGFDFQFDDILNNFPGFFSGSYTFRTLASFAGGRPSGTNEFYQQNFQGPGTTGPRPTRTFASIRSSRRTSGGCAATSPSTWGCGTTCMKTDPPPVHNPDAQLASADIDTSRLDADTNNWGPRLGIAWSPPSGKLAVRGGWGLFYGRTPSIMLGTAHSNNGINIVSLTFTGDAVPTYPNSFGQIPTGGAAARPSIFYIDRDFANSRLMQANAAAEWEVHRDTSLTVTYLFVDGANLPRSIDRNLGTPSTRTFTVAGSGETFPYHFFGADRSFANFTRVIGFESTAESRYNGLTVELNRRLSNHLQYRAAYTLGKVEDTVPDATAVVPGNAGDDVKYASNPANFEADRTVGNNDQRHRLVLSGIYDTNGFDKLQGVMGALVEELVVQRDPHRAVGSAVHRPGRRRRSERRRQYPQRHRSRHRAQPVPSAVDRHLRSPHHARDPDGTRSPAVDLGSVQPLQSRQHQRRGRDLLQRRGHDVDQDDDVWPPAGEHRRTHHAAGGEDHVLERLRAQEAQARSWSTWSKALPEPWPRP